MAAPDGVRSGNERVRLVGVKSGTDWTARMSEFSRVRIHELSSAELCGYVLKKDSPSCGMSRVRVVAPSVSVSRTASTGGATASRTGRGLFAEALLTALPNLPVEEEGRLNDPALRENFVERVFAYGRLRALFSGRWSVGSLVTFHTRHKMQLLSHSRAGYTLGRLVAGAKAVSRSELAAAYEAGFMRTLARLATPGRTLTSWSHPRTAEAIDRRVGSGRAARVDRGTPKGRNPVGGPDHADPPSRPSPRLAVSARAGDLDPHPRSVAQKSRSCESVYLLDVPIPASAV